MDSMTQNQVLLIEIWQSGVRLMHLSWVTGSSPFVESSAI
jgi:hypothetical protein